MNMIENRRRGRLWNWAIISCLTLFMALPAWGGTTDANMVLAKDGKTDYIIVPTEDAIPAEATAARQLQKYLQEITGATFPIRAAKEVDPDAPQILVGAGERVRSLLPRQDWKSLGHDGIVIKTIDKRLILAGGRPRGTLYAVFEFLEKEAGCRWWTPTENTIPHRSLLSVPNQDLVYIPTFPYRDEFNTETRDNPYFAAILRSNGHFMSQDEAWGGHYTIGLKVHTFSRLLPPETYFKDHPEWYSDPANGDLPCTPKSKMPAAQKCQLDLTNPQVLDELTAQALKWIKEHPGVEYLSISQNDNWNYCKSPQSLETARKLGSQSDLLLKFVNDAAERIHKVYPDIKIITLAYYYTIEPPKTIRPAKNVIVRFAPLMADFGHPIDSDWNSRHRDDFLGWAKIAPEMFIWNYATNFTYPMLPHPNWAGLGADLKFYAAHHVTGIFQGGERATGGVGDFLQLRAWVTSRLLWNPSLDQQKLMDEFLNGYYGAASPYLRQYIQLVEQSYLAQKRPLTAGNRDFSFFTLDVTNQAIGLFEKAANAVKNDKALSARVRRARLPLDAIVLMHWTALRRASDQTSIAFAGPSDYKAAVEDFRQVCDKFGAQRFNYDITIDEFAAQLAAAGAVAQVPLPEFARKSPAEDVIDIQPAQMNLFAKGKETWIVHDPAASGQTAAALIGNKVTWNIQVKLGRVLTTQNERWHIYAWVRLETEPSVKPDERGFEMGLYDHGNHKTIAHLTVPVSQAAGNQYHQFDLGSHPLYSDMYIWFTGLKDTPGVKRIYVDRVILMKD